MVTVSARIPYTLCVDFSLGSGPPVQSCVTLTITVQAP
jgi:hypothetical protein